MPGLHATWSRSCVGDKLYTHFCHVETDEDSPQGPEASFTLSMEPLADSPQRISLSDYEDGAPAGELTASRRSLAGHTHFQLPVSCCSYYIISLPMLLALNFTITGG